MPSALVPAGSGDLVEFSSTDPLANEAWGPGVFNQECTALEAPYASVGEVVDSAAIVTTAGAGDNAAGHVLWTIAFDDNGEVADVRILEASIHGRGLGRLSEVVRASLRPQQRELYVRLRLDVGHVGAARLRIGPAQYCPATLINPDAVRLAIAAADRSGSVVVQLHLDRQGHVANSQVVQSSGDATTDRMVLGLVGGMRYSPARLERIQVPSRLTFMIELD